MKAKHRGHAAKAFFLGLGGLITYLAALYGIFPSTMTARDQRRSTDVQTLPNVELICSEDMSSSKPNVVNGTISQFYFATLHQQLKMPLNELHISNGGMLRGEAELMQVVHASEPYASCSLTEHGQVPVSLVDLPFQVMFVPITDLHVGSTVPRIIHVANLTPNEPFRFVVSSATENRIRIKFLNSLTATLAAGSTPTSVPLLRDSSVDTLEGVTFPPAIIQRLPPMRIRLPKDFREHVHILPGSN